MAALDQLTAADTALAGLQDSPDCPDHEAFNFAVSAAQAAIKSAEAMLALEVKPASG